MRKVIILEISREYRREAFAARKHAKIQRVIISSLS